MFTNIFDSTLGSDITVTHTIIILLTALLLGLFISLTYMLTHRKTGWPASLPVTLIMLPAIIAIIILLVGNNVARAFSLAGAFSLIRFRSAPGDPKDIAYIFFTLGAGLACGIGYLGYGVLFATLLCVVMVILEMIDFGKEKGNVMKLKITVPEELNFKGAFDETLQKYTTHYNLTKIKTTDFGTLFVLHYHIRVPKDLDQKAFIDELREKNGNLNISLTLGSMSDEVPA